MIGSSRGSRSPLRGPVYLDASALAKLYLPEPGSDLVEKGLLGRRDIHVSNLSVTAVVSAAARRQREGHLTTEDLSRLHSALLDDVSDQGDFLQVDLDSAVHREAERLLVGGPGPWVSLGLRAADALHLATALSVAARTLVTFDVRLEQAARHVGLNVFPGAPAAR